MGEYLGTPDLSDATLGEARESKNEPEDEVEPNDEPAEEEAGEDETPEETLDTPSAGVGVSQ